MEKQYSIAEIYKLIQDNPNDITYKQLLEQKKQKVISENKKKKKQCLYKKNTEIILECHCETCEKEIQNYGYKRSKLCDVLKYLLSKTVETSGRQNKLVVVGNIFNILLSNDGLRLIESNENFKNIVQSKLIEFYNEEGIFNSYIWYRRLFGERIPIINKG